MAKDPVRLIVKPRRGRDGLFIQPEKTGPERERDEQHNRDRFASHFKFADPFTGNTRTYDEKGDYNCGRCNQADGDKCLLVKIKKIDRAAGSCGDWENLCAGDAEMPLHEKSPEVASYGVAANGKGFGCHRCPYASKAVAPDSKGRDLYCGKGDFRTWGTACCSLNGAPLEGESKMQGFDSGGRVGFAAGGAPFQPPPMITNQPTGPNANEQGPTYSWEFPSAAAQPGKVAAPAGGGAGAGSGSQTPPPPSTANTSMPNLTHMAASGQGPWPAITGGPRGDRNTVGPSLAQIQAYYSPQAVANRQGMANGTIPTWQSRYLSELGVGRQPGQQTGVSDPTQGNPMQTPMQHGWLARGGRAGYADGGGAMLPWFVKRDAASEMEPERGLIHSSVPGRTDRHNVNVIAGSYVMPADVVSGLGEGNTLAGAKVLDRMMHSGPYDTPLAEGRHGNSIPSPPSLAGAGGYRFGQARGGRAQGDGKRVPIVVAGGEYLVHPTDVVKWGRGDLDKGHDALDRFVKVVRAHVAKHTAKLPGPKT